MKVVVDIPEELMDQIRQAIEQGEYEDTREFVTMALENQVELEIGDDRVMTLEQAIEHDTIQHRADGNPAATALPATGSHGPNTLNLLEYDQVSTVRPAEPPRLDPGPLWGQYNRIFPVKLLLRVLANELRNQAAHANFQVDGSGEEWVSLDRFNQQASDIAREYGLKIRQEDKEKSRGRGMRLSAALPVGEEPIKSKERFQVHFIGTTDQQGDLTGAAPHLQFVNITDDSPSLIGITDAGLRFAELWNPLIDGGVSSDQPLSEDEAAFYLQHVQENVPDEFNAMQLVADAITEGDNRPESLSERFAVLNENWSEAQASTVRSGIVSRMYELGLVHRERVGQRGVAYRVTENAQEVLGVHE